MLDKDKILVLEILIADILLMSATVALTYSGSLYFNPLWMNGFKNLPKLILLYDTCLLASNALYPSVIHNRMIRIEAVIRRTIVVCLLTLMHVTFFTGFLEASTHFPRTYTLTTIGVYFVLCLGERFILSKLLKSVRRKKHDIKNILLIGNEKSLLDLFSTFSIPHYGYVIKGTFYDGNCDNFDYNRLRVGSPNDIYSYLATHDDINEIYGFFPPEEFDRLNMLVKYCDNHLVRFYYVPSLNVFSGNQSFSSVEGTPVIARREEPLANPTNKFIKRMFDLIVSSIFLVTIFPWVLLIVGIIIKIKSPGPVFFKQDRTGIDGKVFKCIKFRTMKVNDQADKVQATENDPRKYPFGDFMRKTNIDELPQFVNVFMGDMSIVGPRPHMLKHTEEYSRIINKFMVRHLAKPGITGLAQVSGFRGETRYIDQMEGRVKKDIEYIENWTFLLDLKIIVKTVTNVFGGEKGNAY